MPTNLYCSTCLHRLQNIEQYEKKNLSPKIYPTDKDLKKCWFVKWNDRNGKPCKLQGQMNNLATVKKRLKEGNKIIAKILLPRSTDEKRKDDLVGNLSDLLEYKKPMLVIKSYQSFHYIIKQFAMWYRKARATDKQTQAGDYVRHMFTLGLHKNTIRNRLIVLRSFTNQLISQKSRFTIPLMISK